MPNQCVVVADGARARFFALAVPEVPEVDGGPALLEQQELENRGEARGQKGSSGSVAEEHGARHQEQMGRQFAKQVALKAAHLAQAQGAQHCIVAADPKMLGMLRRELRSVGGRQLTFTELGKDLSRLSVHEIQSHLARAGHLPARRAPRSVPPSANIAPRSVRPALLRIAG